MLIVVHARKGENSKRVSLTLRQVLFIVLLQAIVVLLFQVLHLLVIFLSSIHKQATNLVEETKIEHHFNPGCISKLLHKP